MKIEFDSEKLTEEEVLELIEALEKRDIEGDFGFALCYFKKEMAGGCSKGKPTKIIPALNCYLAQMYLGILPGAPQRYSRRHKRKLVRATIKGNSKILEEFMYFFLDQERTDKE